jgi:hypothetical protein
LLGRWQGTWLDCTLDLFSELPLFAFACLFLHLGFLYSIVASHLTCAHVVIFNFPKNFPLLKDFFTPLVALSADWRSNREKLTIFKIAHTVTVGRP